MYLKLKLLCCFTLNHSYSKKENILTFHCINNLKVNSVLPFLLVFIHHVISCLTQTKHHHKDDFYNISLNYEIQYKKFDIKISNFGGGAVCPDKKGVKLYISEQKNIGGGEGGVWYFEVLLNNNYLGCSNQCIKVTSASIIHSIWKEEYCW